MRADHPDAHLDVLPQIIHVALFVTGGVANFYNLSIVYDELESILNGLNYLALGFVVLLYIKGNVAPTGKDSGVSGNIVFDLFWGTELYPQIFGIDVKQLTNCRFGMVYWAIATISCAAAAADRNNGVVPLTNMTSATLQLIYIFKFFWWETGYFNSIDIMQDRAGYYICWGCLVYLPTVYPSMSVYMVTHHGYLDDCPVTAQLIILLGMFCIWANYDADRMRVDFRKAKGKCEIWGAPAEYITATYTPADGKTRKSILLCSGWWGLSRHFHYIPEILSSFFWSCGAGFSSFMPCVPPKKSHFHPRVLPISLCSHCVILFRNLRFYLFLACPLACTTSRPCLLSVVVGSA